MKFILFGIYFGLMALCFSIMQGAGTYFLFWVSIFIGLCLCFYGIFKK